MPSFKGLVRLVVLLPLVAILAAALLACGGDDDGGDEKATTASGSGGSRNERWVGGLCAAVTSFEADLVARSQSLSNVDPSDPRKTKESIVAFLEAVQKRSVQLKTDIQRLGDPDVKDGKKIQAAFVAAAGDVVKAFDSALKTARGLDTSNPAKLGNDLVTLGTTIEEAGAEIEDTFGQIDRDYDTTKITEVARKKAECAGLFE